MEKFDEWETDSDGKRFRRVGNTVEYEPTILTTYGVLTQRQLADMNARKSKPDFTNSEIPRAKFCPFKTGMRKDCDQDSCAWFTVSGCAKRCPHPAAKRKCPYTHIACTYNCALRGE